MKNTFITLDVTFFITHVRNGSYVNAAHDILVLIAKVSSESIWWGWSEMSRHCLHTQHRVKKAQTTSPTRYLNFKGDGNPGDYYVLYERS